MNLNGSIYPHTSEDKRLRPKHWEVTPAGLQLRRFEGHIRTVLVRNTSWADAPQLWANPQVPDVALQFAFTAAELGEVMLT